jgi:predicted RND superfamily exporter protein
MLVTSAAVSGGFLLLLLSRFEGIANLGLLTGLTLWIAGIADAFLTPVLVRGWGVGGGRRSMRT